MSASETRPEAAMTHPETAPYLDAFAARSATAEPAWLAANRKAALARFAELGFPTRREEAWRYTDLRPLQAKAFPPAHSAASAAPQPLRFAGPAHRVVLVDGRFDAALSEIGALPRGAWLASTAKTLDERPDLARDALAEDERARQPFAALNAAFFADGFVLALDKGVTLDRPVEIVHLAGSAEPRSLHLRSAVVLGEGSHASLIESFSGDGEYWTNAVTAIRVGASASLAHARVQDESAGAMHFALTRASLHAKAHYESFTLTIGARLSRQDILARFDGAGGECRLDGAYCLRHDQEATTATFVDHAVPGCTTRELFKGVIDDRAHGVFLGRIAVRPDAQKSDAQQVNRNLLLSPRAAADTKPELEILADDVKCSHGATVGDLDEEALFYLRSRGIAAEDARRLLIEAFATDALDRVGDLAVREFLAAHLGRWLGRGA
jgi:Fe-S cluster assembly protein SufD